MKLIRSKGKAKLQHHQKLKAGEIERLHNNTIIEAFFVGQSVRHGEVMHAA
jgi:hypothetical protein